MNVANKSSCVVVVFMLHHIIKCCICILRVELPDGSYALVPVGDEEGAGGELHHLEVNQEPDQATEDAQANLAEEGKPRSII